MYSFFYDMTCFETQLSKITALTYKNLGYLDRPFPKVCTQAYLTDCVLEGPVFCEECACVDSKRQWTHSLQVEAVSGFIVPMKGPLFMKLWHVLFNISQSLCFVLWKNRDYVEYGSTKDLVTPCKNRMQRLKEQTIRYNFEYFLVLNIECFFLLISAV